jgi:hypothetical protein
VVGQDGARLQVGAHEKNYPERVVASPGQRPITLGVDMEHSRNSNKESVLGRGHMRRLSLNFILFDDAYSV